MRAVRFIAISALVIGLGTGSAVAGETSGVYEDVYGCINTLLLPPEYTPAGLPELGPNAYLGTLVLEPQSDGTTKATFKGLRQEGSGSNACQGQAEAYFDVGWPGVVFGPLIINGQQYQNCITNIGVDYLLSAEIGGVGLVDGVTSRVATGQFGPGGELLKFQVVPAPRPCRD